MKSKRRVRSVLLTGFWLAVGAGILALLVASVRSQREKVCAGYSIAIDGLGDQWFLNKNDIADMLRINGVIKGRSLHRFDLQQMEEQMKQNPWIRKAELFFDNNLVLQVRISERIPVARIFTNAGNSFYIDSSGEQLPLSDRFSARLPVFTGFPAESAKLSSSDSLLVRHITMLGEYLQQHPFWKAQVAQVAITADRNFELMPVVGNHTIEFGDGTDIETKFKKLMLFYKMVLRKTGMDVYKRINVKFKGQVVCSKTISEH